jgi:hypothetical protein
MAPDHRPRRRPHRDPHAADRNTNCAFRISEHSSPREEPALCGGLFVCT